MICVPSGIYGNGLENIAARSWELFSLGSMMVFVLDVAVISILCVCVGEEEEERAIKRDEN